MLAVLRFRSTKVVDRKYFWPMVQYPLHAPCTRTKLLLTRTGFTSPWESRLTCMHPFCSKIPEGCVQNDHTCIHFVHTQCRKHAAVLCRGTVVLCTRVPLCESKSNVLHVLRMHCHEIPARSSCRRTTMRRMHASLRIPERCVLTTHCYLCMPPW